MNKKIVAMLTATVVALGIMTTNYSSIAYAAEATESVEQVEGETPVSDEMPTEEAPETEEETAKDEKEMDNIDRAKNGVVQINCVYKTSDNISHILRGASGILIGEADGTEYVLTSLALMTPDDETKNSFLTALGVGADDRERATLTYEVVIENDMTTEASLVNSSVDLDLAVFKLSQSLYNRTPMTFLYSADNNKSDYNSVSSAYALGFPDEIVFETNEVYYSNDRVNKTSGQICNIIAEGDTQWVEHTAQVGANNAGGPIITEDGYVIGMNTLRAEGNYYYATSSNTIVKALNGMGLVFSSKTFADLQAEIEADKPAPVEPQVIEKQEKIPVWVIVMTIVLAVVVIVLVVVVIIILVKGNKSNAAKKEEPVKVSPTAQYRAQSTVPAGFAGDSTSSDTTVLGAGTSVSDSMTGTNMAAPSQQLNGGYLERTKNNDNIAITKTNFCIGKDDLHCDYCIRDNNTISRQHAVFTIKGNSVFVEDNHSKNGTFLNDVMLVAGQPQELRVGDVIKLSNEEFVYRK